MGSFTLTVTAAKEAYELVTARLALRLANGWQEEEGDRAVRFVCAAENKEFLRDLAADIQREFPQALCEFGEIENKDWLESWKEFFTPVLCGAKFVILPPWLANEPHGERRKIIIEPKSAFGTGHHASTALCLGALDGLFESGAVNNGGRFLDLGCGTGVLGIGAALAGMRGVCADIDPLAVQNAAENAVLNGVENSVKIIEGSVDEAGEGGFDLIMANILAGPLIAMAPKIRARLADGAALILSGILASQADDAAKAYRALALPEPERLLEGEWSALVWTDLKKGEL